MIYQILKELPFSSKDR